jgi:pimeloyl-ACP methyl ester carboxylesterase
MAPMRRFVTTVPVLISLIASPALARVQPDAPAPRFEEAECPFAAPAEVLEQVRCGWLVVPENRADPQGRQLRLAVAILKSTSTTPRPDPIVFLSGGPGDKSVGNMPSRTTHSLWSRLRAERDVVFFDQRGTGYSEPEFCPEVAEESFRTLFRGLSAEERTERMQRVLARCGEVMRRQGVDLSQYNSVASARDLQDLRQALGYDEWNLLGVSYGTRLALEALRTTPAGIRSVLLDSPAPPNAPQGGGRAVLFVDVIRRLAAACAADEACDTAYPDLEQRIWQTAEELERDPWLIHTAGVMGLPDTIVANGSLFVGGLFRGLYSRDFISAVPLFVEQVRSRNAAMVLAMTGPLSRSSRETSRGMNLAVRCYENVPFYTSTTNEGPGAPYPDVLERIGFSVGSGSAEECAAWHPFRAPAGHAQPVRSEIPTLVLTGEFDPVTHRSFGPLAVAGLTNSHVVEIPAMGHAVSPLHECTRTMISAFFNDPTQPPNRNCIGTEMETVRFVTDVRAMPGAGRLALALAGGRESPTILAALALPLMVLLGSTLSWPVSAGVRRLRRREPLVRTPLERRARWGAVAFTALALLFVGALAWVIQRATVENPLIVLVGVPGWAAPLMALPWLLLAGSAVLVAVAAWAWRSSAWTRWGRVHFTVIALAGAVLVGTLFAMGLV